MLALKKIPVLAKPGVLIVVVITTLLSVLVGYEHNSNGKIEEIATPAARELVSSYNDRGFAR